MILTLALLTTGAMTAQAQKSETLEHYGCTMTYSFSGGRIVESEEEHPFEHSYTVEISPGETITAQAKANDKIYVNQYMVEEKPYIQFDFTAKDANGNVLKKDFDNKNTKVAYRYKVPKNAQTIIMWISRPFSANRSPWVHVTFKVKKGATNTNPTRPTQPTQPTEPTDNVKPENYKGTLLRHGGKMEYSFTNCKVTKKSVALWGGGVPRAAFSTTIYGEVKAGATVNAICKKLEGMKKWKECKIDVHFRGNGGSNIGEKHHKNDNMGKVSFTVPQAAKEVGITLQYTHYNTQFQVLITLKVVKKFTDISGNRFKWNEESEDNRCGTCNGQWSGYWIDTMSDDDNAYLYCNSTQNEQSARRKITTGLINLLYYNDHIWRPGVNSDEDKRVVMRLHRGDEKDVLIFRGRIHVFLVGRERNGDNHWKFLRGLIIGKHLTNTSTNIIESQELYIHPKGTIYILQKDDDKTQAYLLEGSMEVTNKKDNKKVTLKPGQVATGTKDGQMKVQTFDARAMARKYGIDASNIPATTATPTAPATGTTPTQPSRPNTNTGATIEKRYEVERAIVKYKVTSGSTKGTMAKVFDYYGSQERVEQEMGGRTSIQLTQGGFTYSLNPQEKTYQELAGAKLNFMNMNDASMKKLKLQKKGTAKVLGRECTVYANSSTEYSVWKGIVLKKVARSSKGTVVTEATSIELPASVDGNYFKMPQGYKKK